MLGMRLRFSSIVALACVASSALAQPAEEDAPAPAVIAPTPPPAAGAEGSTGDAPAPPPAPFCEPACRDGYTCLNGECVNACNPPCPAGTTCTGTGQCISDAPPPPPTYPGTTATEPPPSDFVAGPDPGAEAHDGFMLRLTIGFGPGGMKFDGSGFDEEYTGFAGTFSVDIGGAPEENLVIHGRLSDFVIVDPSVSVDGMDVGNAEDTTLAALMIAPAITYYFMPVNIYLTAAVGPAWYQISSRGQESEASKAGIGFNFDVGKEWWVGSQWGLGIAARFWYSRVTEDSSAGDVDIRFLAGGLLFSATYQ